MQGDAVNAYLCKYLYTRGHQQVLTHTLCYGTGEIYI